MTAMNIDKLTGVIPPVLTPFDDEGRLIEAEFRGYLSFLLDKGVDGVFILGTAGEGPLLSLPDRKTIAEIAVDEVAGRKPVVVQAGAMSTQETIELVKQAASIGASAACILPLWYFAMDDEALFQHYAAISCAAPDLPIMIYYYPSIGSAVSPQLAKRIADACPNIVGVKDSGESIPTMAEFQRLLCPNFRILTGSVHLVAASLWMGAHGIINSMSQTFPELSLALYKACVDGDRQRALELQLLLSTARNLMSRPVFLAQQKLVMHWRGFGRWHVRAPNRELTSEEVQALRRALDELGGLEALTAF